MTPREIIAEAWAITRRVKSLRRWGYFSSFFELLLSLKMISYQAYFLFEYYHGSTAGFFDIEIFIYNSMAHWVFWTFVITISLLFIVELFIPHLAAGAIIGLAAKSHMKEKTDGGLVLALYNFFPIFAIHEFLILASFSTAFTFISIVMRYIEGDGKTFIISVIIAIWLFSNLLKFFFNFAPEIVVIDRQGIFHSMGRSFKLIVSYLGRIMFLLVLLFVISLRILFNTAVVLIIPGLILGISFLLGTFLPPFLTWLIASIVGIALIVIASYFFAYLHVFKQTVWTITYLELRKHKDLDVIG